MSARNWWFIFLLLSLIDVGGHVIGEDLKVDDESKLKVEKEILRLMVQALDSVATTAENEDQDIDYNKE